MVIFSLIMIYFPAAMGTIYFLVRVLIPRVRGAKEVNDNPEEEQSEDINPTFFGGFSQFETPDEYAKYLRTIATDDKKLYKMFSAQVFSLGLINQRKNNSLRKSMGFFVTAFLQAESFPQKMSNPISIISTNHIICNFFQFCLCIYRSVAFVRKFEHT